MKENVAFCDEKSWIRAIRKDKKLLASVPEQFCTLRLQKIILNTDWRSIRYIKNPCTEIQYFAIAKSPLAIKYIDVQDEDVVRTVLKQDWKYAKFVKNGALLEQLVQDNADLIKFIKKPSEELQMNVVCINPQNIEYISNPTKKVQLCAVGKNPKVIQYIKNPEKDVQLEAFKQDKSCASLIDNPCQEVKSYLLHEQIIQENKMSEDKFNDYFKRLQESILKTGFSNKIQNGQRGC